MDMCNQWCSSRLFFLFFFLFFFFSGPSYVLALMTQVAMISYNAVLGRLIVVHCWEFSISPEYFFSL